jgi:hypothetical protein
MAAASRYFSAVRPARRGSRKRRRRAMSVKKNLIRNLVISEGRQFPARTERIALKIPSRDEGRNHRSRK